MHLPDEWNKLARNMADRKRPYPFDEFEPAWQKRWDEEKTFHVSNPGEPGFDASKPKRYILDMFPYPSGAGLHVGHPEGYTATDIVSRFLRRNGYNVLHPMGWDSFGLPAEQYAIKTGQHPSITTASNIDTFRRQLKMLGFSYDWDREIATTDPKYVRWTQWIFLRLYNSYYNTDLKKSRPISELEDKGWTREQIDSVRLAYVAEGMVNWSPDMGTVLANEEAEEWRSKGFTIERRKLRQWMLRITAYAERLIDELEPLDWPESIKILQRNWIGKSTGAEVVFAYGEHKITVYTTRPDTLFGATYMVLSPEHELVGQITSSEQREAVQAYQKACAEKSDLERTDLSKEKTGVFTGAYAVNPVNGKQIPIWIADYVLTGYGTGAIMAVPAHDERDFEFATKFSLPIVQVVQPDDPSISWQDFCGYNGTMVNSEYLNGLPVPQAKATMIQKLEEMGCGHGKVNYKLRDWLFSRQRYWGEPFPILWDKETGFHHPLPESELPLLQPEMEDFKPSGDPRGPLVKATQWIHYSDRYTRETNTMPQWAGSCWYYLRYLDPHNDHQFVSPEVEKYWMGSTGNPGGVDLYVGGTEHAVLHLLYARFWHKVLFDYGLVSTNEPFNKLVNQGLILGEDGQKMSKSRGNVVNPDDIVREYGADAIRMYEMFMGPLKEVKPWATKGVEGISRFLARVWRIAMTEDQAGNWVATNKVVPSDLGLSPVRRELHRTIKKVTEDIHTMSFNTAISKMMECTNAMTSAERVSLQDYIGLLHVLNPFAPHITEELNRRLCELFPSLPKEQLALQPWPTFDPNLLVELTKEIPVQVNGKLRDKLQLPNDATREEMEIAALASPRVQEFIAEKSVRKVIVVPGRLVNVVVS